MGVMQLNGVYSLAHGQSWYVSRVSVVSSNPPFYARLLWAECPSCPCDFWLPGNWGRQLLTLPWTILNPSFGFSFGVSSTLPRTSRGQRLLTEESRECSTRGRMT